MSALNPVRTVREAYGVTQFKLASWLGIGMKELCDCERDGTWPHTERAKARLIEIAATEGITLAPLGPDAEPSLF